MREIILSLNVFLIFFEEKLFENSSQYHKKLIKKERKIKMKIEMNFILLKSFHPTV